MSLLDGDTVVLVQRRTRSLDEDGNPAVTDDGDPVEVACRVHVLTADESAARGLETTTTRKVIARTWPADERGRVLWDGRWWDTHGEPERYGASPRTRHVTTTIRTAKSAREV